MCSLKRVTVRMGMVLTEGVYDFERGNSRVMEIGGNTVQIRRQLLNGVLNS